MRLWLAWLVLLLSTPAWAENQLADRILVEKSKRTLALYAQDKPLKTYHVSLGKYPKGPKRKEGDLKTPEGFYVISGRKANSQYHLALQISYPDDLDTERAHKQGVNPGGRILIHGQPEDYGKRKRRRDWTHGCIAVNNQEIDEIWRIVPDGTPIEIRP